MGRPRAVRSARSERSSRLDLSRLLRSPDILVGWDQERLFVKDLAGQREIVSSPETVALLDLFGKPRTAAGAADLLPEYERASVLRSIRRLASIGLLLPEKEGRRRLSRLGIWKQNLASAQYHVACRDPRYLVRPAELDRYLRERVATRRRPPRFKRYPAAPRVTLPKGRPRWPPPSHFEGVLGARRTTREFAPQPVLLEDFAALVRGTWGKSGEIATEHLGKLTTKTSPSAGALHPIECYALVSNVRGLASGLYHYEVGRDELRAARSGTDAKRRRPGGLGSGMGRPGRFPLHHDRRLRTNALEVSARVPLTAFSGSRPAISRRASVSLPPPASSDPSSGTRSRIPRSKSSSALTASGSFPSTSAEPASRLGKPMRQSIAHVALVVRDYDEAIAFFTQKLKLRARRRPLSACSRTSGGWSWLLRDRPARPCCSLGPRNESRSRSSATRPAGECSSSSQPTTSGAITGEMTGRGVRFVRPPSEQDYGLVAVFEDLYGNRWDLIQYAEDQPRHSGSSAP